MWRPASSPGLTGRRERDGFFLGTPGDVGQVAGDVQAVELEANVSGCREAQRSSGLTQAISISDELASDEFGMGEAIGGLSGEGMPNSDEQLAGDGDNGFVTTEMGLEAGEFGFPMGVSIGGDLGGFDQGGAQVASAGFGDAAGTSGKAGVMDAGTQASVTDQGLGFGEAGDVANS